jgi:hypothetical protein
MSIPKHPSINLQTLNQFASRIGDLEFLFRFSEHEDRELIDHLVEQYGSRREDFASKTTNDIWSELQSHQSEYGLAFDYVRSGTFEDQAIGYFRYQLSFGGPTEEFRFYVDPEHNLIKAEFWLLDWFTGSCIDCTLQQTVIAMWEYFRDVDLSQSALQTAMAD